MFIDSHCHLDFKEYEKDLDAVIERAQKAGVKGMLAVADKLAHADRIIALGRKV